MNCKYGRFCTPDWPCSYCRRERIAELEAKERAARGATPISFFTHSETSDERDARIAREAQERIARRAENRRQAAEAVGDSPGAIIGIGLGALAGLLIGAAVDSSDKVSERSKARAAKGPMKPARKLGKK
jgi:hypothetical protein